MSRWKVILRAWPPAAALFVVLSFGVTVFWLWHAWFGIPEGEFGWLEPLSAILAGAGAFVLAVILIFRKVDNARVEANAYGLARGLATGYYFAFIRPVVEAMAKPDHPLHARVADEGGHELVGVVAGLPQSEEEFDSESQKASTKN